MTVSTLYNAEYEADCKIKDEDKTAFDWCKEGNVKEMTKIIEKSKTGANVKDDQVYHRICSVRNVDTNTRGGPTVGCAPHLVASSTPLENPKAP